MQRKRHCSTSATATSAAAMLSKRFLSAAALVPAGLQLDFSEFASLYGDIFTPLQPMLAQQQHLHAAGVPTYLLSNCSALHIADVARRHPRLLSTFDACCLSYQASVRGEAGGRRHTMVLSMAV